MVMESRVNEYIYYKLHSRCKIGDKEMLEIKNWIISPSP